MLDNEEKTLSSLNSCRDIIDSFISKHGGRIFHTAGDSVLAEFSSSVEAVNCAINFQDAIHERNQNIGDDSDDRKLIWRDCIHCDDVIVEKRNRRMAVSPQDYGCVCLYMYMYTTGVCVVYVYVYMYMYMYMCMYMYVYMHVYMHMYLYT